MSSAEPKGCCASALQSITELQSNLISLGSLASGGVVPTAMCGSQLSNVNEF